jgi:hypothetical protein
MKKVAMSAQLEGYGGKPLEQINALLDRDDVDGLISFENQQMDSSSFGVRTQVAYGPGCTYKKPEDVEGKWLNDLPSQRQYPVSYAEKEQS